MLCSIYMKVYLILGKEFPQSVFAFYLIIERSCLCAYDTLWVIRYSVVVSNKKHQLQGLERK